jgi:multidrug efflux system membrane fusion protein
MLSFKKRSNIIILAFMAFSILGILLSLLGGENHLKAQTQEQSTPSVKVITLKSEPTQIWNEYSGRGQAVNIAEIRPQVSGTISEVKFEDGATVQKGDVLFIIDPRPFQAAVQQAEAELDAEKNQAKFNKKEYSRAKVLVKTDAISERVFDDRSNQSKVADASVLAAEARLSKAQINLDHAYVKAPFDGRMSRAEITTGNLVEAGPNAPVLATIVSNKGIYIDFEVDEKTYSNSIRQYAKNHKEERKIPVKINLDGNDAKYNGHIHTFDNRIDPTTGTIRARAFFENTNQLLLPGMFVSVEMGRPSLEKYILINERAIGTNQDRKFAFVVNEKSHVEYRQIQIGENIGNQRIIKSGLVEGDKVILDGFISVRPGMEVTPTEVSKTEI